MDSLYEGADAQDSNLQTALQWSAAYRLSIHPCYIFSILKSLFLFTALFQL